MSAGAAADVAASVVAPLRIGLLGASRIAELAVTEASRHTGDVRAAVAARDPQRARAYAAEHGYDTVRDSYDDLVADDSLDLIYIGLPNAMHAEWTVRALAAGRHVLVEKPFAANLAEFDAVARRYATAQTAAWEAFHYADHPLMARLIEIVQSGEIGELREVRVSMRMPEPAESDPRWNFDLAGGALMDVGCYAVNALLGLGDALALDLRLEGAEADPSPRDARVDAAIRASFTLGAVPATVQASMTHHTHDFSITVIGATGQVHAANFVKPQLDDRLIVAVADGGGVGVGDAEVVERVERLGTVPSYTYQLRRVRDAVRGEGDARDQVDLGRSRRTMAMIDAIYEATGLPLRPARFTD